MATVSRYVCTMKRDIYSKLKAWKVSKRRKPLVLKGARQVGKTYILKEFGRREYSSVAYFNFEENPALGDFFGQTLDPEKVIDNLEIYTGRKIVAGKDLIIFDEIQSSPAALNALKYFREKAGDYHVAAAGSLIGIRLAATGSFPVGQVNFLDLYPMTFLEFLDAAGQGGLRRLLDEKMDFTPFPLPFHNELIEWLKRYSIVGGMPEPVSTFAETGDLAATRTSQKEIIDAYLLDFSKHAPVPDIPKLGLVWDSIPVHLSRENKKFIFSALKKSARAREYENALKWLEDAGLIYKSLCVDTAKSPLKGYTAGGSFKIFMLDVGLLSAMAGISPKTIIEGNSLFDQYKGAFVENYVAQQLKARLDIVLYYWTSKGKKAELDFLCEIDAAVLPLEAKAGINPKSKSLRSYDNQFNPPVLLRTSLLNLKKDGKICNIPLYAIAMLADYVKYAR